jgi:hypothetical protein
LLEHVPDQFQHRSVAEVFGDPFQQSILWDVVEETYDTLPTSETFPLKFA